MIEGFIAINRKSRTPVKTSRQLFSIQTYSVMKKIFGILAIALAICISAFTSSNKRERQAGNSYSYDLYGFPDQDELNNVNNPANYSNVGYGILYCPGSAHRCGVQNASDNGLGQPDFNKPYTIKTRN